MKNVAASLLLMSLVAGCGGSPKTDRPAVVPAEGVLYYQGKPLGGATLTLAPEATGSDAYAASALTDDDGHFSLSSFPPDPGIVPGKYKVGISKTVAPPPLDPSQHDQPASATMPKFVIPQKYNDPNTSGQALDLPTEGRTDLKFDLK